MGFLGGRTSAAHYGGTLASQLYKFMLIIFQTNLREKKYMDVYVEGEMIQHVL